MTENIYSKNGANISITKIEASHCYCCGELFQSSGEKKKTKHHCIPEEFEPVRNFTLPICLGCHKKIHTGTSMIQEDKVKLRRIVSGMINQYKAVDEKFNTIMEILK